jgi:hypothetical protein
LTSKVLIDCLIGAVVGGAAAAVLYVVYILAVQPSCRSTLADKPILEPGRVHSLDAIEWACRRSIERSRVRRREG